MANTLLSPELARVLRDIDNARVAINEKYTANGGPTQLPSPLKSGDMANAIRAIVSYGDINSNNANIELSFDKREIELPEGAYKEGIHAKLKDYAVSYIWNMEGMEAQTRYINIGEPFEIPDFLNGETKVGHATLLGWSKRPTLTDDESEPEYKTGQTVDNFEGEPRDYDSPWYISRLYAIWKSLYTYTLTYHPNGGRYNSEREVIQETISNTEEESHIFALNAEEEPILEHSKFLGWGLDENTKNTAQNATATIDTPNITVYAVWQKLNRYTLTYELLGGSVEPPGLEPEIIEDAEGNTHVFPIKKDPEPTKEGYEFGGWAESHNSTVPIQSIEATVTSPNVKVWAIWNPLNTYKVHYDPNGGEGGPEPSIKANIKDTSYKFTTLKQTPEPIRAGYKFCGWGSSETSTPKNAITSKIVYQNKPEVAVYAIWKELIKFKLTYYLNGAPDPNGPKIVESDPSAEDKHTFELDPSYIPTWKKHNFIGWGKSETSTKPLSPPKKEATYSKPEVYVYAIWEELYDYTLTYEANADDAVKGKLPSPWTVKDQAGDYTFTPLAQKDLPERPHYSFRGWGKEYNSSNTTEKIKATPKTPDVVAYALWKPLNTYTLQYHLNDSIDSEATWDGWNDIPSPNPITKEEKVNGVSHMIKREDVLEKSYPFTLVMDPPPFRDGYTFRGWGTSPDTTKTRDDITAKEKEPNVEVFAVWKELNKYVLTYNLNDNLESQAEWDLSLANPPPPISNNQIIIEKEVKDFYEFTLIQSPQPTRPGYTFLGWSTNQDSVGRTTKQVTARRATPNVTVYAVWKELNNYTVTYYLNDLDDPDNPAEWEPLSIDPSLASKDPRLELDGIVYKMIHEGEKKDSYPFDLVDLPPRRNHYRFIGWSTNINSVGSTTTRVTATKGDPNREVYAVWDKLNIYTLQYDLNDPDDNATWVKEPFPMDPVKEKLEDGIIKVVDEPKVYYWFKLNGKPYPIKPGYICRGWHSNDSTETKRDKKVKATPSNDNRIVYAVWDKLNTYTVTYYLNDDPNSPAEWDLESNPPPLLTSDKKISLEHDNGIYKTVHGDEEKDSYNFDLIQEPDPSRGNNYTFLGWSKNSNSIDGTVLSVNLTKDSPNEIVYAVWKEINTYILSYHLNDDLNNPATWNPPDPSDATDIDKVINEKNKVIVKSFEKQFPFELVEYPPPERNGYKFSGWARSSDSTKRITDIKAIESDRDVEVFAIWTPVYDYSLTYDLNGEGVTKGPEPLTEEVLKQTVKSHTFNLKYDKDRDPYRGDLYIFKGWGISSDSEEKIPGNKITVTYDSPHVTVYAIWDEMHIYILYFDSGEGYWIGGNGGTHFGVHANSTEEKHTVEINTLIPDGGMGSVPPVRAGGYEFKGWGLTKDCIFEDRVTEVTFTPENPEITVYAIWGEKPYVLQGVVKNAVTGNPVTGQICQLTFTMKNQDLDMAPKRSCVNTSAADGSYEINTLHPDIEYDLEIRASGFDTEHFSVSFPSSENPARRDFVINPLLAEDEFFRAILEWDSDPNDIDTHIKDESMSPCIEGNLSEFINYVKRQHSFSSGSTLILDCDNTRGYGPETTTLKNSKNATFIYYVVNYTRVGNMSKTNVRVRVKVKDSNEHTQTITIREQDTNYLVWNVFKYDNGTITILDTYECPLESIGLGSNGPFTKPMQFVDLRLQSLSIFPGSLSPTFDKDIHDYTLTIPHDTESLTFNTALVDGKAEIDNDVTISGDDDLSNFEVALHPNDGMTVDRIILDVIAKPSYENLNTINGNYNDGKTGRYIINVIYNDSPAEPDEPSPAEPDEPSDTSEYYNISEVKDFTDQWGYTELDGNRAMQELYTRIYNCFVNNGKKKIKYTKLDGSGDITQDALFDASAFSSDWNIYDKYLYVPTEDLGLTTDEIYRVHNIVEYDCPEILWQWKQRGSRTCGGNSSVVVFHLMCHFNESTRANYLSTMESTFQEICSLIKTHYNIDYVEDTFYNNNKRYTNVQKKQIAKVIHDFIETHNHYGDTSMDATQPPWVDGVMLNQIAYPALSKGKYDPICASYSQAFKYCCDKWGISCICVAGHVNNEQDGNHAWNMVSYEQKTPRELGMQGSYWQEVDCTWDDISKRSILTSYTAQGLTEQMLTDTCIWDHFNVTTAEINDGIITKTVKFEGTQLELPSAKGAKRYKDVYEASNQSSGKNSNGSPEIGVYLKYPNGTCDSNKYDGNTVYGGF